MEQPFLDQFDEMDIGFIQGKKLIKLAQICPENILRNHKGRLCSPLHGFISKSFPDPVMIRYLFDSPFEITKWLSVGRINLFYR